ncbi:DUF3558 domain-containing protein [Streptomyces sp. NBC_01408]|uniref:DUF3558 domain-containing protein n=1 Tax=Streptomyces sp. NBC_01408 TaxID=2903855 RepID=UPI0022520855|nr:DUF3558 domain-containing protein [Streptomyces sp. NBC_01408]MCX4691753.1 DUF3558 domain-containing protein [Streptomyces sp. NBC_01408]
MQRKAVRGVLPGIAMLTALLAGAAGLAACTGGGDTRSTSDSKPGGSTAAPPAPPGKYRSLPQPCKAADAKRVKAMLPAGDSLTEEQRQQLYAGTADASFDGDRRVGCRWTAQTPEETRLLSVGFERVVSYDRAVASDDDKARQVYVRQLTDAHLPFPGPATTPTAPTAPTSPAPTPSTGAAGGGSAPPAPGTPAPGGSPSGSPSAGPANPSGSPAATPSGSPSPPPELGSRVLEGLGNDAFLDDKLSPAGATAAQSRTVRIVFRTSNVIVTVEYSVQPALPGTVPPSTETQESAQELAQALVERFNE